MICGVLETSISAIRKKLHFCKINSK